MRKQRPRETKEHVQAERSKIQTQVFLTVTKLSPYQQVHLRLWEVSELEAPGAKPRLFTRGVRSHWRDLGSDVIWLIA